MVFRVVTWIITVIIGAVRALCENAPLENEVSTDSLHCLPPAPRRTGRVGDLSHSVSTGVALGRYLQQALGRLGRLVVSDTRLPNACTASPPRKTGPQGTRERARPAARPLHNPVLSEVCVHGLMQRIGMPPPASHRGSPSRLRTAFSYGGAFLLGLLCMHTMSRLVSGDAPAPQGHVPKQDQPVAVVEPKGAVVQPPQPVPAPPAQTVPQAAPPAAADPPKAKGGPTYCDLINTVNELGKSVQDKRLSVNDLLHVLSQSIKPFTFVQV